MVQFDAVKFLIEKFGTPANVLAMFSSYGISAPDIGAIEKWYPRRRVPGEWLPLLLIMLELDEGQPVSLAAWIAVGERG